MTSSKSYRVVLTGGPCSGKSTSLASISDRLKSLGFDVFVVPEVATMMILGGVSVRQPDVAVSMQIQTTFIKMQLDLERHFAKMAALSTKPTVMICDRGAVDGRAFIKPDMWQAILDENDWSNVGLRDKHYDAVIHLVTAAIGAPEAYTLENNAARTETLEEAAAIDRKIQDAWIGHPHFRVIDNTVDFSEKVRRVCAAVCNVVGVPEPVERERKFLVSHNRGMGTIPFQNVDIEQTYLKSDNGVARVRKRGQDGSYSYTHTVKHFLSAGKNIELERMISSREYLSFLSQADPDRMVIKKRRTCFLWENQYFELDMFETPYQLCMLEAEIENDDTNVTLPPFLTIEREVTSDPNYSNAELALKTKETV